MLPNERFAAHVNKMKYLMSQLVGFKSNVEDVALAVLIQVYAWRSLWESQLLKNLPNLTLDELITFFKNEEKRRPIIKSWGDSSLIKKNYKGKKCSIFGKNNHYISESQNKGNRTCSSQLAKASVQMRRVESSTIQCPSRPLSLFNS